MLAVGVLDDGDALKFIPSGSLAIDVLKSEDVGRLEDLVVVVDQVPAGEVVDVHADLDFPRLHLVQLDAGVEAGKQDHGAKYQQKDEDREEAPHTRFFDLLHFLSDLILLVVVRIELAAVQNVVYVLQFEPLEQIQRRLDERPIHYHLQLSKKGNCPDPLIAISCTASGARHITVSRPEFSGHPKERELRTKLARPVLPANQGQRELLHLLHEQLLSERVLHLVLCLLCAECILAQVRL